MVKFRSSLTLAQVCFYNTVLIKYMGRITKANLSWSWTPAKFCQLIVSLSAFLSFFFVLKVRLKDLKFEFCQLKSKQNFR